MTFISPGFTCSTGAEGENKKMDISSQYELLNKTGFEVRGRPEEGTEGEGLMSGQWNAGCLKPTGRVFSGNS